MFSSLKTVSVSGLAGDHHSGVVLAYDYSVEAFKETHMPYIYLTIASMLIYVLGIPLAVFMALKVNQKYLFANGLTSEEERTRHMDIVDEFGTLYLQYEPEYWWWEVTVIFKKMLLTGAMTIVAPGSSAQLAIAILIVLANVLVVLKTGPFVDTTDDWLSFLMSLQMFATLLGGLLLMTDDPVSPTYDPTFMGATMVVVNSFGFLALVLSLVALHPKVRTCINTKFDENHHHSNSLTKVCPEEQKGIGLKNWGPEMPADADADADAEEVQDAVQFPKKKSVSASAGTKKGAGVSVITTVALILGTMTMCVQGSSHSRHGNPSAPISVVEKVPMNLISFVVVVAVGVLLLLLPLHGLNLLGGARRPR